MKYLALILAVVALLIPASPVGAQRAKGVIRIETSVADVRTAGDVGYQGSRRFVVMRIWTHPPTGLPIGHAVMNCVFVGRGGLLGAGLWTCLTVYRMPLGYITAAGLLHSFKRYTLAVTGGTGVYAGAGGVVFAIRGFTRITLV